MGDHGYCQHMGDGNCELEDRLASVLGISIKNDAYDELSDAIAELQSRIDRAANVLQGDGESQSVWMAGNEALAILQGKK